MGTAEISLILSGAAGAASIGAVVITYRLGRERLNHERRLSDLETVRRVLDDAASAMQRADSALKTISSHLADYADQGPGQIRNDQLIRSDESTLDKTRDELDALAGRLRIRFGSEHELVTIYEGAVTAALEVAYRVEQIAEEFVSPPGVAVGNNRERILHAVREFAIARDSFTLVAYRVAGVKLPAKQLADV